MKNRIDNRKKSVFTVNTLARELLNSFLYKDIALTTIIKQGLYLSNNPFYDGVDINIIRPEAKNLNIDIKVMRNMVDGFNKQKNNETRLKYLRNIFQDVWNDKKLV